MNAAEIRKIFLDFFASKEHQIVPSAPMVVKNDPTLMFTNAGMNQFKDIFLGNISAKYKRVADTQKCLRVSGKHNDLEEVGIDTYHHTMFEMLGNWSFGDYFKREAIAWSWELLTDVFKIPKDRFYATVFEGDEKNKLAFDKESYGYWKQYLPEDRILRGNRKDNFWEMGDTGPCGPCSEIHVDIRSDEERKKKDGKELVNAGHPHVIEIWNNVFIEFNAKVDGTLEQLPAKHVDTGMGFERLCMVLQNKISNYDTDVFQPLIQFISTRTGFKYEEKQEDGTDANLYEGVMRVRRSIAMRVMSDHIRAITFAIADGQLPSNNKAGYVIRRILRRAVRYAFTFLKLNEPFLYKLVPILSEQFNDVFPEVKAQQDFIMRVIQEEESSFLRTLENGIKNFNSYIAIESQLKKKQVISGTFAFELYDTFGFPIDLTQLMARESNWSVDMDGFNNCLTQQKERSRAAANVDTEDWIVLKKEEDALEFVGYELLESDCEILRYRKVKAKGKEQFQLVLNKTPFYAESGGQVGDTGYLQSGDEKILITDTQKENNLIIHFTDKLPKNLGGTFQAVVNGDRRKIITSNHSATHLMHSALKRVLGAHVNQKGSLVNEHVTRFDFSHFAKVTDEEIEKIEKMVNEKIRENILLDEKRNVPIKQATEMGATALFGEKYGEFVRVITFDPNYSRELCGGTHVKATGQIGQFKIISESSVAAGVRRVEAITGELVEKYSNEQSEKEMADISALEEKIEFRKKEIEELEEKLNASQRKIVTGSKDNIEDMVEQILNGLAKIEGDKEALRKADEALQKVVAKLINEIAKNIKNDLQKKIKAVNGINFLAEKIDLNNADAIKSISFALKKEVENLFFLAAADLDGKPHLSLIISDNLVKEKNLDASKIIRELAKEIQGGGGGQAFYATAGGKNPEGLNKALEKGLTVIS